MTGDPDRLAATEALIERLANELLRVRKRSTSGLAARSFEGAAELKKLRRVVALAGQGRSLEEAARIELIRSFDRLDDDDDAAARLFFGVGKVFKLQDRNRLAAKAVHEEPDPWLRRERMMRFTTTIARALVELEDEETDELEEESVEVALLAALEYDPRVDGSFRITRWSPDAGLADADVRIKRSARPKQRWLDDGVHARRVAAQGEAIQNDPLAYLVDYEIDWEEGPESEMLRLWLAEGTYAEQVATIECLETDVNSRDKVLSAMRSGQLREFAQSAPPSSLGAMVALTDDSGRVLVVERSAGVRYERHHWMVGVTELMKPFSETSSNYRDNGLVNVIHRCLNRELGLVPSEYTEPFISWIGYWAPSACVNFIAHVTVRISEAEISARRRTARDAREIEAAEWLTIEAAAQEITRPRRGRQWTVHSRLMLNEILLTQGINEVSLQRRQG